MYKSTRSTPCSFAVSSCLLVAIVMLQACASDDLDANNIQDDDSSLRDLTDMDMARADMGPGLQDMTSGDMQDSGDASDSGTQDQDVLPTQDMNRTDQGMDTGMDADMNVPTDMRMADMLPSDMGGVDMGTPGACQSALLTNQTFELHASGFAGQYYTRSVFDGEGVWTVFAMRESAGSGTPDIWLTRTGCDGRALVAPFEIGEMATGIQEVSPAIAALGDEVYVAWVEDTSSDDRIKMRSFTADGTPQQALPVDVTPKVGSLPISGLFTEIDIAALGQDRAVIAVSHYASRAASFQIALQRIDFAGALLGDPMEPIEEKGVDQTRPSVTGVEGGGFYVSWSRYKAANTATGSPAEPHRVVYTRFEANATEPDQGGPFPAQPGSPKDNQLGRYSKERTSNNKVFLAFQSDSTGSNDILIKDGTFGASVTTGFVGNSGYDLRPSISARPDGTGGAVTWYRASPSPTINEVHIQRFDVMSNGSFMFGPDTVIQSVEKARAPYGPSITHVTGNVYFISWQSGSSTGTAKAQGRFVQL